MKRKSNSHPKAATAKRNWKWKPSRSYLLAGSAVLVLAVLIIAFWQFGSKKTLACSTNTEGSILRQAAVVLEPSDFEKMRQLQGVVEKIEKLEGYQKDFNCVYPIVFYDLHMRNTDSAERHYGYLEQAQKSGQTISDLYRHRASVEDIKELVEHLSTTEKRIEQNSLYIR